MHSPRGLYASALNHTNHERQAAGVDSHNLRLKALIFKGKQRGSKGLDPITSKKAATSPDFYYCMNRVHNDGTSIDNPYLDLTNPLRLQIESPKNPKSTNAQRSGGYPSDQTKKNPNDVNAVRKDASPNVATAPTWPR